MSEPAVAQNKDAIATNEAPARSARPKRLNQAIYLAAAIFLLNSLLTYSAETRSAVTLNIGDTIPDFSLDLLDGNRVTQADFAGKPMMYIFYAGWCPCSHESVNYLKKAHKNNQEAGLGAYFIGIQDSVKNLTRYAKTHKLKFPVTVSGGDGLARSVGVKTTPTTIFVDGQGVIRSIYFGKVEEYNQLSEGLKSILPPTADAA